MNHFFVSTEIDKYFKRPKEFLPERFLRTTQGELSNKNVHPFAMMPFGFGPRSCIGMRLAQMEVETAVAKVDIKTDKVVFVVNFLFAGGKKFLFGLAACRPKIRHEFDLWNYIAS